MEKGWSQKTSGWVPLLCRPLPSTIRHVGTIDGNHDRRATGTQPPYLWHRYRSIRAGMANRKDISEVAKILK